MYDAPLRTITGKLDHYKQRIALMEFGCGTILLHGIKFLLLREYVALFMLINKCLFIKEVPPNGK